MTDVKAQELSLDEWYALLEPYGWADIRTWAPAMLGRSAPILEYEIRVMLKPSDTELEEWPQRAYLLEQARQAVDTVRARGYLMASAPRIEFGGEYRYRVDRGAVPEWTAEAELSFRLSCLSGS